VKEDVNKVTISGVAGVLGSTLANFFLERGIDVRGIDIQRINEAWRLKGIRERIEYTWKSTWDIEKEDIRDSDLVVDCAIQFADRPMGTSSPTHTLSGNLYPSLNMLEACRKLNKEDKPVLIYPSSFNSLYGNVPATLSEDTSLLPSSIYGWSKASAELLYKTYHKSFGIPSIVTRVGSAYGPKGRSDELIHKLIIYGLQDRDFYLYSPRAERLWTYVKDVLSFYDHLLDNLESNIGKTLHCVGNKSDKTIENIELARMVKDLTDSNMEIEKGEYEAGEIVDGEPISFDIDSSYTRRKLDWQPEYSLKEGLKETIKWFREKWKKSVS